MLARLPITRRSETAFTLVELIVVLVLAAVIFGMVGTMLVGAIGGSRGSTSSAAADAAVARATQVLRDDLASAITPDRRDSLVRDPVAFKRVVQRGGTLRGSDPANPGALLDVDDVVIATRDQLAFRADVDATPGTECVSWSTSRANGLMTLTRHIDRATQCGTGRIDTRTMFTADLRGEDIEQEPFEYELVCHRTQCAGSRAPSTAPCRPWKQRGAEDRQLRWIVGVRARFTVLTGEAKAASGTTSMSLRSREASSYRRALGC